MAEKKQTVFVVRATRLGYYEGRKRRGQVFKYTFGPGEKSLPSWVEEHKSGMEDLPEQAGSLPPGGQTPANTNEALTQAIRARLDAASISYHPRLGLEKLQELMDGAGLHLDEGSGE